MHTWIHRCSLGAALAAMALCAMGAGPAIGIGGDQAGPDDQPRIGIQQGNVPGSGAAASGSGGQDNASTGTAAHAPGQTAVPDAGASATLVTGGTATAPAEKWVAGDPAGNMLNAMAFKFGVILVMPKTSAVVLKDGEVPKTLEAAQEMVRESLEPQGWGIEQTVTSKPDPRVIWKVAPLKDVRTAEEQTGPVTSGPDAGAINVKDPAQPSTHLLTVNHADQLETLEKKAREDKSVEVDLVGSAKGGYTLIFRGPAMKVKQAVAAVAAMDKPTDTTPAVRQMKLTRLDAEAAAATINANYSAQGRVRAVADKRTNTVIVSGPEDQVIDAMVALIGMDLGGRGGEGVPGAGDSLGGPPQGAGAGAAQPAAPPRGATPGR